MSRERGNREAERSVSFGGAAALCKMALDYGTLSKRNDQDNEGLLLGNDPQLDSLFPSPTLSFPLPFLHAHV